MKKKHIFKFVTSILIITMFTILIPSIHSANFTLSKSSVTLNVGKTQTININASTATGRIDISSSNSSVAYADTTSAWVENNSRTIVITGKSQGTATITISGELYNSETDEEKVFTKTINVTVNKVVENTTKPSTNTSQNTSKPSTSTSTTKPSINSGGSSSSSGSTSSSSSSNRNQSNNTNKQNISSSAANQNQVNSNNEVIKEQPITPEIINEEITTEVIEENDANIEVIDIQENLEEEKEPQDVDAKDINTNKSFIGYSIIALTLVSIVVGIILIKKIWKK